MVVDVAELGAGADLAAADAGGLDGRFVLRAITFFTIESYGAWGHAQRQAPALLSVIALEIPFPHFTRSGRFRFSTPT